MFVTLLMNKWPCSFLYSQHRLFPNKNLIVERLRRRGAAEGCSDFFFFFVLTNYRIRHAKPFIHSCNRTEIASWRLKRNIEGIVLCTVCLILQSESSCHMWITKQSVALLWKPFSFVSNHNSVCCNLKKKKKRNPILFCRLSQYGHLCLSNVPSVHRISSVLMALLKEYGQDIHADWIIYFYLVLKF